MIERKAEHDLRQHISDVLDEYDLTTLEALRLLNHVCSDRISSILKFELRVERHGKEDKPADVE
jgi:hypothetical protein